MKIIYNPGRESWESLLKRPEISFGTLMATVQKILDDVKDSGDEALKKFSLEFDGIALDEIRVSETEIRDAKSSVPDSLRKAIQLARTNIEKFHSIQAPGEISCETSKGVRVWQRSVPIDRVGLYIPGGTAPLLSTVLMLGVPAQLAGCPEIVLCTPPGKDGKIDPSILYIADLLGIKNIFKAGGAQAIGAMSYGTESIPRVYKIFGPGNQYVQAAKMIVSTENIAIDMPAGPSELAVIADRTSNPSFIASDLLSQAEHGTDSQVLLVTTDEEILKNVRTEIGRQVQMLPRKEIAERSLENSMLILLATDDEMIDIVNLYSPEHLIIVTSDNQRISEGIRNAGSVFLGEFTPESAGDYASGTNHTLPTNGNARAYSGVNLGSFMKTISFQEISREGLINIGPAIEKLASAEALEAHRRAISIRLAKTK